MKKQYLTSTQREVLLEMCKKMFPELNENIEWYTDQNDLTSDKIIDNSEECEEFIIFNPFPRDEDETSAITIHWCELCITKLGKKILKYDNLISHMIYLHNAEKMHLIDYLYHMFKQK